MPTTDPALLRALEVSGGFLHAVTLAIVVLGLLVVAASLRKSPEK